MKFTLIVEDTTTGVDVQMVGMHNEIPCAHADSLSAALIAQLGGLLIMQQRLGLRVTERGGKPSWLA